MVLPAGGIETVSQLLATHTESCIPALRNDCAFTEFNLMFFDEIIYYRVSLAALLYVGSVPGGDKIGQVFLSRCHELVKQVFTNNLV